ncbi:TonB-dependent receptor plug domain-containing protein [Sphingomonas sp. ac-8]|uniref:TonB-dependent receptor plug domain-containing protein n=1 Tax=Sphingomonas sp. ac-8 TaxID=3242977 RepID=UPI003A80826A
MISSFQKRSVLRGTTALSALVFVGVATPAFAQTSTTVAPDEATTALAPAPQETATETTGADIVVTGSILRRTDAETPSPVSVLSAESLAQRGINTVAEAVQRVSANGAGTITQGWNNGSNFATGANAVSLRGLTVQSTLTVFDGLRMAPYPLADDGHRNFVDLNTIPNAVVDRIEILRDGASSTYGADAIAGVVNVIMKKEVQGVHANGSSGITSRGDGSEQRFDLTTGYGDLQEQGFNVYVNGEYQKTARIMARDRSYPIGTADLSRICLDGSSTICMPNGVQFGINADGTLGTGTTTTAALVAPSTITGTRTGTYRLLNTELGCAVAPGLTPVTLTPGQQQTGTGALAGVPTYAAQQCQQDLRAQYSTIQPEQERYGFVARATVNVGDQAQAYFSGAYYNVNTVTTAAAGAFNNQTPPPGTVLLNPVVLPVYVCGAGIGSFSGGVNVSTGCTAANGTLNPNNPFAAAGSNAILRGRYDRPTRIESNARSLRGAAGISGSFGDDWTYSADFTASNVKLDIVQNNYLIPQRIATVVAQGTYNFYNQGLNSEEIRDFIAPENRTTSNSDLWQFQATIGRKLFALPGGDLQAAVGVAYRHESIDNPSANPENISNPYDRYYTLNAVGAIGSRNVKSAFFEIGAPILDVLEVNGSGRYDDYSSGQSNFSPKVGVKFTPVRQLAIRGTWSRGFRIPSFNEAFGLPTTGYSNSTVNCTTYAAFCASHQNNAYVTGPYSVGTTSVGNPALDPEKSRSITAGVVFEPIRNVSFTVDYFNIKVKDLISGISPEAIEEATRQYYTNNGVVDVPGVIAIPGVADPLNPGALPLLGFLQSSYRNADSQEVAGIDFGANVHFNLTDSVTLTSSFEATYLLKYDFFSNGTKYKYAGTLSPCDYTSCSGSPRWRGSWQNTLAFGDFSLTGVVYYTSPFDLNAVDYGEDDCTFVNGQGIKGYKGNNTPVQCRSKAVWNFDLTANVKVSDSFSLFTNVLNVLDIKAPLDVSAAYGTPRYNPAWAQPNAVGRFIRVGAKVDF